jgi:2-polyprenyl-3-methyl-5-hydroxy-6-metoxy-1,4-benzoquinol methylase|tara:strand:- start:2066 stop:2698 length:633 start_codon:yes stop_codon:yes gene_type:complete
MRTKEELNALVKEWSAQEWAVEQDRGFMQVEKAYSFKDMMESTPYKFAWVKKNAKGVGKALDIGCGNGMMAHHLLDIGYEVVGVDVGELTLKAATKNVPKAKYVLVKVDEQLPFLDGQFDCVTCLEVIEHVRDLKSFVSEAVRVCKRGGQMFFTTPVDKHYDCDQHLRYFKFYDLEELFDGFPVKEFRICRIHKNTLNAGRNLFGVEVIR